jgi:hypothetical protein
VTKKAAALKNLEIAFRMNANAQKLAADAIADLVAAEDDDVRDDDSRVEAKPKKVRRRGPAPIVVPEGTHITDLDVARARRGLRKAGFVVDDRKGKK